MHGLFGNEVTGEDLKWRGEGETASVFPVYESQSVRIREHNRVEVFLGETGNFVEGVEVLGEEEQVKETDGLPAHLKRLIKRIISIRQYPFIWAITNSIF